MNRVVLIALVGVALTSSVDAAALSEYVVTWTSGEAEVADPIPGDPGVGTFAVASRKDWTVGRLPDSVVGLQPLSEGLRVVGLSSTGAEISQATGLGDPRAIALENTDPSICHFASTTFNVQLPKDPAQPIVALRFYSVTLDGSLSLLGESPAP